jgi:hypothetical protein
MCCSERRALPHRRHVVITIAALGCGAVAEFGALGGITRYATTSPQKTAVEAHASDGGSIDNRYFRARPYRGESRHRGIGGHVWLEVAIWFNAPGALVFLAGCAAIIVATGCLGEIPHLTFLIISACISTVIYSFAGLWLDVILEGRRMRREIESRSQQAVPVNHSL